MKTRANPLICSCRLLLAATCWATTLPLAVAQESVAPQDATPAQTAPQPTESAADIASRSDATTYTLRADTELHLRMLDAVGSNTHKRLDHFKLELVEPIVFEGQEIAPVGTLAEGEVVHSAKAGMAGKAGELILATRWLQLGDQRIKLRSFSAGTGQNRYNLANGLVITLGLPGLFVVGKNIAVPSGTDVYAKVASDHVLPIPVSQAQSQSPQSSAPAATETPSTQAVDQNENTPQ